MGFPTDVFGEGSWGEGFWGGGTYGTGADIASVLASGNARPLPSGFELGPTYKEGSSPAKKLKPGVFDHSLHKQSALVDALSEQWPWRML